MNHGKANPFQTLVWQFQSIYSTSAAYNLAYDLSLEIHDKSKINHIKSSIEEAIKMYPLARAKFDFDQELTIQIDPNHEGWTILDRHDTYKEGEEFEAEARRISSIPFLLKDNKWIKVYILKTDKKIHFLFITHHIIWDGSCFNLFLSDLKQLLAGQAPKLIKKQSPLEYLGYLDSESQYKETEKLQESELSLDFQRPKYSKRTGDRILFSFDQHLVSSIQETAHNLKVTPYQFILAYTLAWISEATRNPTPSLVSPFSNRSNTKTYLLKGPLVGTGKNFAHIDGATTWNNLLDQIKDNFHKAKKEAFCSSKGTTPFPKSPFILTFQNQYNEEINIPGISDINLRSLSPYCSKSDFEWMIILNDSKMPSWKGWVEYDTEILSEWTAQNLTQSWLNGLKKAVEIPNLGRENVKALHLISSDQYKQIQDWNKTDSDIPNKSLTQLFDEQVLKTPKSTALIAFEHSYTFEQIDQKSDELASEILKLGNGKIKFVGLSFHRSSELVIAILATIKSGAAYIPLDPELPNMRLKEMIDEANPGIIITKNYIKKFQDASKNIPIIYYDTENTKINHIGKVKTKISLDDPAYLIFTSGSTGKPKGAINSHSAIVNRLKWHQKEYKLKEGQRVLQKTPYTFDVSVWEFFWPLLEGGVLVLNPPNDHKDPVRIIDQIKTDQINYIHFVPSMLEAFLDEVSHQKVSLSSLKKVLCSGEALKRSTCQRFFSLFPDVELHNLYGPTECAVDVTAIQIRPQEFSPVTIGKPISNIRIHIMNPHQVELPLGCSGEIVISGIGVGLGYIGQEDLTQEKFIYHPNWGRMYRTGDLGKFLPSGEILYLGRLDFQVKWKGFRIELNEIEERINAADPEVSSIVRLRDQNSLVAYLRFSQKNDTKDYLLKKLSILQSISAYLPDYMLPNEWRIVDSLPLSTHGKLDQKLLDQYSTRIDNSIKDSKPVNTNLTSIEVLLISVWKEVLDHTEVNLQTSFFECGGDSLKILRIRSKMRSFGFDFDVSQFLLDPTLKGMSKALKTSNPISKTKESYLPSANEEQWLRNISPGATAYPARELELALVYIAESRSHEHPGTYHDVFHVKVNTSYTANELEQRWYELNKIHPVLRANLYMDAPDKPLWILSEQPKASWFNLPKKTDASSWIKDLIENDIYAFDMKSGPLVRMFCIENNQGTELIISFHHAVMDGWSASVLLTSLLSKDTISYIPYDFLGSSWKREQLALNSKKSIHFWKNKLRHVEPTLLSPVAKNQQEIEYSWDQNALTHLLSICGKNSFSLKNLLLAVHLRALQLITHSESVTTGVITNGRGILEGADTIGLYLLNLPYCTTQTGSVITIAKEMKELENEIELHKYFPLSKIIQLSGHEQIFNTAFNFTHFEAYNKFIGENQNSELTAFENTEFLLLCNWHIQSSLDNPLKLRLIHQWADKKLTPEFVRLVYQDLIQELLFSTPVRHNEFNSRPEYSEKNILGRWKDTHKEIAAIHFQDGTHLKTWSYEDLKDRTSYWKKKISGLDVKRATLELPRTPEAISIMLALSELNICIIPIDQTMPEIRRRDILSEASPNIRFVQEGNEIKIVSYQGHFQEKKDAFYILFTSGSTGKPKGIEMGKEAFSRLIGWQNQPPSDVITSQTNRPLITLQFASWGFDVSFQEIFSTLCQGGTLLIPSDELRKDFFEVTRWAQQMKVERIFLPFVLLNHFCSTSLLENLTYDGLQMVITAGEQLELTQPIIHFFEKHTKARLFNQYGPTESHVVTEAWVDPSNKNSPRLPPIGYPIWGVKLSIVNPFLRDNSIIREGLPGELWIGGSCLANGYLKSSPKWIEKNGERWYKSGDLVQVILPEKSLQYLGRIDAQLKVNGHRIEPSEIESQLFSVAQYAGISPTQTAVWFCKESKTLLSAIVTSTIYSSQAEEDILLGLKELLPSAMVPSKIFFVTQKDIPLSLNGKVDRKKLNDLSKNWSNPSKINKETKRIELTPVEMNILKSWEDILGRSLINHITSSEEAHFGKLGGNSLSYLRLISKLSKDTGRKLRLEDLIRRPTLSQQARWIKGEGLDSRRKLPETCIELFRPIRMPKATLVIFHPIGGSIQCYEELVDELRSYCRENDIRIIGVQSPRTPIKGIPQLAEKYLQDLRSGLILLDGHPFHLMGWSFGGVLAVEIASQMEQKNYRLDSLVLLDSIALKEKLQVPINLETQIEWFFWELLNIFQSFPVELEKSIQRILISGTITNIDDALKALEDCLAQAKKFGLKIDIDKSDIRHFFTAFNQNLEGLQTYIPPQIKNSLHLFRCQEPLPERLKSVHQFVGTQFDDPAHGWQRICQHPVNLHYVGGDHVTLIRKPHVEFLAKKWMGIHKQKV